MTDEGFSTPEPPQAWRAHALCAQADPEAWFADAQHPNKARKAQRICASCPSEEACLAYALADPSLEGIWGGKSRAERRRLRGDGR